MLLKKITSKKRSINKIGLQRHTSIKKLKLAYKKSLKKSLKKRQFGGAQEIYRNSVPVKRIVLYALSANPPTLAHEDIIRQLSEKYDAVFIWASSNPLKLNASLPEYDPLYKSEVARSELLNEVLTTLQNVKVDYTQGIDAKYNHANTGISVKKFIDANLSENTPIQQDAITFKQFNLKTQTPHNDSDFLTLKCGISPENNVELWVCFGLDVVRDTPTWGPNNVFLTCATGIVMINRVGEGGEERAGPGLFSIAKNTEYEIQVNPEKVEPTVFLKMPFFDWFPYSNDSKRRNIDVASVKFNTEFKEITSYPILSQLFANLETEGNLKLRHTFDDARLDKYLVPIEISEIKVEAQFSNASSTKVRNLAVQGELGRKKDSGADSILKQLVNPIIKDEIYRIYGNPTRQEQIAIIDKSFKGKKMSASEIQSRMSEMTPSEIQAEVLEIMKDTELNTLLGE